MTNAKRLVLVGVYFSFSMIGYLIFNSTGDLFAALVSSAFAIATICNALIILRSYKGDKR